jgi:hypothetical protein
MTSMPRLRTLLPLICLATCLAPAVADEPAWTEIVVTPRRVPEPILDIELFPSDADRVRGNAAPILLRLTWEQQPTLMEQIRRAGDYQGGTLAEFDLEKFRKEVPLVRYSELKRAAYRTTAEWEYPLRETRDLHHVLLPDVQGLRAFGMMLSAHARADVKEGKVDDALEKIRVGFGVADQMGRTPFLIVKLVQNASQRLFLDRVEELQQVEAAPNLYWALTRLPRPLVELGTTADWETRFVVANVPDLLDLERPRTREEWRRTGELLVKLLSEFDSDWQARIREAGGKKQAMAGYLKRARARLPEVSPEVAERVPAMSDEEVGVRYFAARVLIENDRAVSVLHLPPAEGLPLLREFRQRRAAWSEEEPELEIVVGNFVAGALPIWGAQRRVAALRIVAALRDHAARHEGELPATLDAIADLPIPVDPFTNRPFEYRVEDGVATLVGEPVTIDEKPEFGLRYRIRVR